MAGQGLGGNDIVSPDPAGRADGKAGLRARGEFAGGLAVAAKIGGLGGGEIGLGVISLLAIGHRELTVAKRRLGLAGHRSAKDGDRLVGVGLVVGSDQRLPK